MQYCYGAASSLDVDSKLAINAKLKSRPVSFLLLFRRTALAHWHMTAWRKYCPPTYLSTNKNRLQQSTLPSCAVIGWKIPSSHHAPMRRIVRRKLHGLDLSVETAWLASTSHGCWPLEPNKTSIFWSQTIGLGHLKVGSVSAEWCAILSLVHLGVATIMHKGMFCKDIIQ